MLPPWPNARLAVARLHAGPRCHRAGIAPAQCWRGRSSGHHTESAREENVVITVTGAFWLGVVVGFIAGVVALATVGLVLVSKFKPHV